MILRTVLGAAVGLALTASAVGQDQLKVGDAAPGLDIANWVKGEETTIETGKPYVVEFWATWCAPCRKSIPHLTKLQKEFEEDGLTIIGVSNEEEKTVSKFVRGQGSKMDYTVAVDRGQGTTRAWMQAAGQNGIPCAFIVNDKGKISFIGHPMSEEFDETLERVVSGRFDPVLESRAAPAVKAARNARKLRNWRLAQQHYEEILALDGAVFATVGLEHFEMLLVDMKQKEEAYDYAKSKLLDTHYAADAEALRMLARKIAVDPKIETADRDLDFALEVAEAAQRVAGKNDAESLATLALVRFHRGEVDQAIALQKQAYFTASPRHKPEFKRTLQTYETAGERASAMKSKPGA